CWSLVRLVTYHLTNEATASSNVRKKFYVIFSSVKLLKSCLKVTERKKSGNIFLLSASNRRTIGLDEIIMGFLGVADVLP
ncbi:MAG: hypothetical protein ABW104_16210, partial [Candidatus Thiodiazotropha sp. 6PLUC2]